MTRQPEQALKLIEAPAVLLPVVNGVQHSSPPEQDFLEGWAPQIEKRLSDPDPTPNSKKRVPRNRGSQPGFLEAPLNTTPISWDVNYHLPNEPTPITPP